MSTAKEFEGKSVDDAIAQACNFFAVDRDDLEIEIIRGASAGIFGLVGVKKALIRAQKRKISPAEEQQVSTEIAVQEEQIQYEQEAGQEEKLEEKTVNIDTQDLQALETLIRSSVTKLIEPITTSFKLHIDMSAKPINVHIDDQDNSGLIIGRDGQTITAFQYMLNRIIARNWSYNTRIQLDTGDYREKQNEKLKETALYLAQKSKNSGRVLSTKPLSSYHRRVVHMALQHDKSILTRSKGDGPLKRVLIMPKRERRQFNNSKFANANAN